jgi:NAD(P)-dependent dehydrogenase (short-subunit alcohol dehydrogenase family)
MAGRVQGKVAFVTGAGLEEGRSHAVRLAEEGADIIAIAVEGSSGTCGLGSDLTTERYLADTAELIKALGRRVFTGVGHTRDYGQLKALMDFGCEMFGRLDIVVATAGNASYRVSDEIGEASWNERSHRARCQGPVAYHERGRLLPAGPGHGFNSRVRVGSRCHRSPRAGSLCDRTARGLSG